MICSFYFGEREFRHSIEMRNRIVIDVTREKIRHLILQPTIERRSGVTIQYQTFVDIQPRVGQEKDLLAVRRWRTPS